MPSTETLAANQGQNRSRGRPCRSASSMVFRPFSSIDRPPPAPPLPAAAPDGAGGLVIGVKLLGGGGDPIVPDPLGIRQCLGDRLGAEERRAELGGEILYRLAHAEGHRIEDRLPV